VVYDRAAHEPALRRQMGGDKKILDAHLQLPSGKSVLDVVRIFREGAKGNPERARDGRRRSRSPSAERRLAHSASSTTCISSGASTRSRRCSQSAICFASVRPRVFSAWSALEALASGAPAGYDVGGLREVVKDGVTGALRPVGDNDGLAEFASRWLKDPARWKTMAPRRRRPRARFSSDQIVASTSRCTSARNRGRSLR